MYEYAVIFTWQGSKYAILVKEANGPTEAIKAAMAEADAAGKSYSQVEAVMTV